MRGRRVPPEVRLAVRRLWHTSALRSARRGTVKVLRRSATARRLAQQVFAVRPARDGVPVDVSAGTLLGGLGTEQLPVVLVLMIGTPPAAVGSVVEEVARLQVLHASFRPVFVLDSPMFGPVRRFGYPVELLVGREDWSDPTSTWEEYLRVRLASIRRHFRSTAMIRLGADGLDAVDRAVLSGDR